MHKYDQYGWYTGEGSGDRCTDVAPENLSLSGSTRANWTGYGWVDRVYTPPPPVYPPVEDFTAAITAHLDATAQTRRYDDRITCMVRAGFAGPFQAEAQAFALWADSCNALAYQLLAEVEAGTRPMPTTTQELIDALPPMIWPT